MKNVGLLVWALVPVLACFSSCGRQETKTVIARVGNAQLTLEEARTRIDTSRSSYNTRLSRYVAQWVNAELLHQEALQRGIDRTDEFRSRMEDAKRQLVNQQYINETIFTDTAGTDEQSLRGYFTDRGAEFIVREPTIKLALASFATRERASAFAASVSRGTAWNDALQDTAFSTSLLSTVSGRYYTERTLFPAELWKVANALGIGDVSFPVKTADAFWVLKPLAVFSPGKQADYDMVREEVRGRVLIARRHQLYDSLLGTLRKRYNVEIMLGPLEESDTHE
jgi:hypothetical protein